MDYLTVEEFADLKKCTVQYTRRLLKEGKIASIQEINSKGRPKYLIPVSALPENLQAKYYSQMKQEAGVAPELKEEPDSKPVKKAFKKHFEDYSEHERERIAFWNGIVREWQTFREKYKKKSLADSDFAALCRSRYGEDFCISPQILYRKQKAYREHDYDALLDKRGKWERTENSMNEDVWKMFTKLYLSANQPTVSRCYTLVKAWVRDYFPELYHDIPSERTFRRRIAEIPDAVIAYTRLGQKACFDRYCEYVERDYAELQANDIWIADNHTLDITTLSPEGKPHRLSLTAYMDAKSGVIVGWNLCDHPNSQSTLLALRAAALNGYGLPRGVYFDNGSEFLTHDIGGRGHRNQADWNKEETPPTILSLLGITMVNALVKNAKAKNIERYFNTFKNFISKAFNSYTGGTPAERPENHSKIVKSKNIPTDEDIRKLLPTLINGGYNCHEYGGKEKQFKGMTKLEVWNRSINSAEVQFRDAADEDLTLLMARSTHYQQIERNGVYIELWKQKLWFSHPNLMYCSKTKDGQKRKVYVRYDPANLESVRVYDKETDKFLCECKRADHLNVPYHAEDEEGLTKVENAQKHIRQTQKAIKNAAKSYTNCELIDMLAATIHEAESNLDKLQIQRPATVYPVTAAELNEQYPGRDSIISVTISEEAEQQLKELEEINAMNERLTRAKGA